MKRFLLLLVVLLGLAFVVWAATIKRWGNGKGGAAEGGPLVSIQIDTQRLAQAWDSAARSAKDTLAQTERAIQNADYAGAMARLKELARQAELTEEQKRAVQRLSTQVKDAVVAGAAKTKAAAEQAVSAAKAAVGQAPAGAKAAADRAAAQTQALAGRANLEAQAAVEKASADLKKIRDDLSAGK